MEMLDAELPLEGDVDPIIPVIVNQNESTDSQIIVDDRSPDVAIDSSIQIESKSESNCSDAEIILEILPVNSLTPDESKHDDSCTEKSLEMTSTNEVVEIHTETAIQGIDSPLLSCEDELARCQQENLELKNAARELLLAGNLSDFDCGRPGHPPHLSLIRAREKAGTMRPTTDEWDELELKHKRYPLESSLGMFQWPLGGILGKYIPWFNQTDSILDKYGAGMVFYFKMIKTLGIVFGLMTLITLPTLVLFSESNSEPPIELMYMETVNSQNTLATSTIAALHEPIPSCREAYDTEKFEFSCPQSFSISSVVAYYGQDWGSCACPGPLQPDQAGYCLGNVDPKNPNQCEVDPITGEIVSCFSGNTRYLNNCCSYNVTATGQADMTSLNMHPNFKCNSYTAPFIAIALCAGQKDCKFKVLPDEVFEFYTAALPPYANIEAVCEEVFTNGAGDQVCKTTLSYGGFFDDCVVSSNRSMGLIFEAVCVSTTLDIHGILYQPEYVVQVASSLNTIAIIVFILAVCWMGHIQHQDAQETGRLTCTASDYTVLCLTLPDARPGSEETDPDEQFTVLKNHFESQVIPLPEEEEVEHALQQIGNSANVADGAGDIELATATASEPAELPAHEQRQITPVVNTELEHVQVADINFSTTYHSYLDSACDRGAAAIAVDKTVAKINSQMDRFEFDEESAEGKALVAALKKNLLLFEAANDTCKKLSEKASKNMHSAYVTFANEQSFLAILKQYPNVGMFTPFMQPKEIRLENKKTLFIDRAPNPTEIIWENVSIPWWGQLIRVCITTFMTLLILGISYAMVYEATFLASLFNQNQNLQACSTFNILVSQDPVLMSNTSVNTITYQDVLYDVNPTYYNMTSTDYGSLGYLFCYCQGVLFEAKGDVASLANYQFFDGPTDTYQPYCTTMIAGSGKATAANYLATFVILLVNSNLTAMLRVFVNFERLSDKTREIMSLTMKLFIAEYINTAMLTLIIQGDVRKAGGQDISFGTSGYINFGLFTGADQDYDTTWYYTAGASMMFTMFMYTFGNLPSIAFTIVMGKLVKFWDRRWDCKKNTTHLDTQAELDEMQLGPPVAMEEKFAAILTLIFVDLTYSATMPLMNFITFMNLCVLYGIDKHLLLRFHCNPPELNPALPRLMVQTFYWAALIHGCNALWMFGNNAFYKPAIDTVASVESVMVNATTTMDFAVLSHNWNLPIVWTARAFGKDSVFMFAVMCALGAYLAINFIRDIILEYLGLSIFVRYASLYLNKNLPILKQYNIVLPTMEPEAEGNVPYFDSIPLDMLLMRASSGLLAANIQEIYEKRIAVMEAAEAAVPENGQHHRRASAFRHSVHVIKDAAAVDAAGEGQELHTSSDHDRDVETGLDTSEGGVDNQKNAETRQPFGLLSGDKAYSPAPVTETESSSLQLSSARDDDAGGEAEDVASMHSQSVAPSVMSRAEEAETGKRMLQGHESYNMATSPEYSIKYGLETEHLKRVCPDDWVVTAAKLPPMTVADRPSLAKLIHACKPTRDENGEIPFWEVLKNKIM